MSAHGSSPWVCHMFYPAGPGWTRHVQTSWDRADCRRGDVWADCRCDGWVYDKRPGSCNFATQALRSCVKSTMHVLSSVQGPKTTSQTFKQHVCLNARCMPCLATHTDYQPARSEHGSAHPQPVRRYQPHRTLGLGPDRLLKRLYGRHCNISTSKISGTSQRLF